MIAAQIDRRTLRRTAPHVRHVEADICVVGSGAAGISAALEAAQLGRKVCLVDAQQALGGQAVHGIVGTFCGLYSNGPRPYQVTYGIASDILDDLGRRGALRPRLGRNTLIQQYDEIALARFVERVVRGCGITLLLGSVLRQVKIEGRRVVRLELATRYGDVSLSANGFVDASGDAVVSWLGGLDVQEATRDIYGTVMVTLEGIDETEFAKVTRAEITGRLTANGREYGLVRRDGFVFSMTGTGTALVNMSHIPTPLDPIGMAEAALDGREQTDSVLSFLKAEFPAPFRNARIRSYGAPGIRQTRTIRGSSTLTADQVRNGARSADAIARCSWPIELHDDPTEAHWEIFGDDHMHYVPLGCMLASETDNVVAAGRCVDADPVALSSVRVIGPCIAMGAAAAHALDMAGASSVHQIDVELLQRRVHDNLNRHDLAPLP